MIFRYMRRSICFFGFLIQGFFAYGDAYDPSYTLVFGHRGMGAHDLVHTENSVSSVLEAIRGGADGVEFDVQLTADLKVVVAHDKKLERLSDGKGCLSLKTLSQLKKYHLKDGSGQIYLDQSFSTLEDLLSLIDKAQGLLKNKVQLDIHIKSYDGLKGDFDGLGFECEPTSWQFLAEMTYQIVKKSGLMSQVIFTSFDRRIIDQIKQKDFKARTGALYFIATSPWINDAISFGHDVIVLNGSMPGVAEQMTEVHARGKDVYLWFSNRESQSEDQKKYLSVEGLIFDHPLEWVGTKRNLFWWQKWLGWQ